MLLHVPGPASGITNHLSRTDTEGGITALGDLRPSTNLGYERLAHDLYAFGWLKDPIPFRRHRTLTDDTK